MTALCAHLKASCIDTRRHKDGYRIRRYRCLDCNERYSSVEVVVGQLVKGKGPSPLDLLKKKLCQDENQLKRKWLNAMIEELPKQ